MQKQIIHVIRLQILETVLKHLLSLLERVLLGTEIAQLGSNEILVTRVTTGLQGLAQRLLTASTAIGWRCIEIVHSMVKGILTETIDFLLVQFILLRILLSASATTLDSRQAHPSVSQDTHLLPCLGIGSVRHHAGGHWCGVMPCSIQSFILTACLHSTSCQHTGSSHGTAGLQKLSSVYILAHIGIFYASTMCQISR